MNDDTDDTVRDAPDWIAEDEPMTDTQRVYLETLAGETGEPTPPDDLTKAEAAALIDQLKQEVDVEVSEEIAAKLGDDRDHK